MTIAHSAKTESAAPATVTFCATGKTGVGHLRRVTNIAAALRAMAPAARIRLLTNAAPAALSQGELGNFDEILVAPRERMTHRLAQTPSGTVVVDTAHLPGLDLLPNPLVLVLRETVASRLATFRLERGRAWDAVIVPNPAAHWCPDAETIGTHRVINSGWIYRAADVDGTDRVLPRARSDQERTVLIASGGGGNRDTAREVRETANRLVRDLRRVARVPLRVLQVAGPRAMAEDRMSEADANIDVGARLNLAFAEADLVVSTVGYNSTLELAAADTPTLLLSIDRTYDDQLARALAWEQALGHAYRPASHELAVTWMSGVLRDRRRRRPVALGTSGSELAAREILAVAAAADSAANDQLFVKSHSDPADAMAAANRSVRLFLDGARTLPHRVFANGHAIAARRLAGPTTREILAATGPASRMDRIASWADHMAPAIEALASLHACRPEPLALAPHDALRRIRPRLVPSILSQLAVRGVPAGDVEGLARRVSHAAHCSARKPVVLHGDFHSGQLVHDAPGGGLWLIDFDDLALGAPEADIANFAVHACTSIDLYTGPIEDGVAVLVEGLTSLYRWAARTELSPRRLYAFAAASLLRRLLKLAAAGRFEPNPAEIFKAAEGLLSLSGHQHPVMPVTSARHSTTDPSKEFETGSVRQ